VTEAHDASLFATALQLRRFVGFVARRFILFRAIVALTVVVLVLEYSATSLMIPLSSGGNSNGSVVRFWRHVLDALQMPAKPQSWLWLFFVVMAARLVFGYLQTISTTLLGRQVHRTLSGKIFSHVVGVESLTSVYKRSVGHYITLAGDDTFRCGTIITSLLQCCVTLCTALVAMVILWQFSPQLFVGVSAFILVCAMTIALLFRYILRLNAQSNILSRELNTAFVEAINNLRSIRALHAERFVVDSYARQIFRYVRMLFGIDAVRAGIRSLPAVLLLVIAAFALRTGSSLTLSEATLLAVTIIIIRIFASLGQFIGQGALLLTDIRAVRDIDTLTGRFDSGSELLPARSGPHIESLELREVDFGYGSKTPILTNFSYQFRKGHTYAIVGSSGSGKSTLADIMLGLIPPERGRVLINGGSVTIADVRTRLLLVEQQPRIFSNSLRENLLFGFTASDDALWDALRLVDLEYTVKHMRDGLDTVLTYQGENFSGGQRQRIGIARALIRNPDVLILDEATSALDVTTRSAVIASVKRRMHTGVLVLITHDPHLLELADQVINFEQLQRRDPAVIAR
jgi:ABC-type bacteriocin/lantibiotic exporter with double-glycine peptidase domain